MRFALLLAFTLTGCQNPAQDAGGPTLADCDADGDGSLGDGEGCVVNDTRADCDDADPDVHPGALEVCDGVDNDCSGVVDDAVDADADGSGACEDCDDQDRTVRPGAAEVCDGVDQDCDGLVDDGFDADGDGWSPCDGDCDDADPRRAAGLPDLCNGYDDDCDGLVDEDSDLDGDGWTTCRGDCDDADPAVWYGAPESCDGVDQDCDGGVDDLPECWACYASGAYEVCLAPTDRATAQGVCAALAGGLAVPRDGASNEALAAAVGALTGAPVWIGPTDDDVEGAWVDPSGDDLVYLGWAPGQPDDLDGEDCVVVDVTGLWDDVDCDGGFGFVCE